MSPKTCISFYQHPLLRYLSECGHQYLMTLTPLVDDCLKFGISNINFHMQQTNLWDEVYSFCCLCVRVKCKFQCVLSFYTHTWGIAFKIWFLMSWKMINEDTLYWCGSSNRCPAWGQWILRMQVNKKSNKLCLPGFTGTSDSCHRYSN